MPVDRNKPTQLFLRTPARIRREFGQRLRALRLLLNDLEFGLHTQRQWAEWLGVRQSMISEWESGKSMPSMETIAMIADACDVPIDLLVRGFLTATTSSRFAERYAAENPLLVVSQADVRAERLAEAERYRKKMQPPAKKPRRVRRSAGQHPLQQKAGDPVQ